MQIRLAVPADQEAVCAIDAAVIGSRKRLPLVDRLP